MNQCNFESKKKKYTQTHNVPITVAINVVIMKKEKKTIESAFNKMSYVLTGLLVNHGSSWYEVFNVLFTGHFYHYPTFIS